MPRLLPPSHLTSKDFYFNHVDGISNSDLTKVFKTLPDNPVAFLNGNLVDAMITQLEELPSATKEEVEKAYIISEKIKDRFGALLPLAEPQAIFQNTLDFTIEGDVYQITGKCLADLYFGQANTIIDIKTTKSTSQKSFEKAVEFFEYDRQGSWYMTVSGVQKFILAGFGPKGEGPFIVQIAADTKWHQSGIMKTMHCLKYLLMQRGIIQSKPIHVEL